MRYTWEKYPTNNQELDFAAATGFIAGWKTSLLMTRLHSPSVRHGGGVGGAVASATLVNSTFVGEISIG